VCGRRSEKVQRGDDFDNEWKGGGLAKGNAVWINLGRFGGVWFWNVFGMNFQKGKKGHIFGKFEFISSIRGVLSGYWRWFGDNKVKE
jgi:hypothetical protein